MAAPRELTRPEWIMLAAIAVVMGAVTWQVFTLRSPCAGDDAYIAFRYAQNLVGGHGLVFNPSEHIWGYTSPLHVLVLALLAGFGAGIPTAALLLGIAANGLSAWLMFRLLTQVIGREAALVVGVVMLVSHVTFQYLSLETPLVGALMWSFVALACTERPALTGIVGALACLARPDAALLVVPILALVPGLRRPRCWIAFAVPGIVWIAFCALYYGDVIPNSFRAKFGGAPRLEYFRWLLGQVTRWGTGLIERESPYEAPAIGVSLVFAAIAVAATVVLVKTPKLRARRPLAVALVGYPWAMFAAYAVMRPSIGHDWEYWNALTFQLVGIGVAVVVVTTRVKVGARWARHVGAVALALVFALGTRGKLAAIAASDDGYWDGARYRSYDAVASWILTHAPTANLFAGEPGILAYRTELTVYDGFLISRHPVMAPDLFLLQGRYPTAETFGDHYRRVHEFPANGFVQLTLLARSGFTISR